MKSILALSAGLLLCGCAVLPRVDNHILSEPGAKDGWIPYQLTDTTLVIGVSAQTPNQGSPAGAGGSGAGGGAKPAPAATGAAPSSGAAKPGGASAGGSTPAQGALQQPVTRSELFPVKLDRIDVTCVADNCDGLVAVSATPISFEGLTLAIEPKYHEFIRTFAAPTYFPNSLRLKTLEFAIRDERQEALDTVFAVAAGARQLSTAGSKSLNSIALHLPVVIDLKDAKATAGGAFKPLPNNAGAWWYRIEFLDDPKAAGFLPQANFRDVHEAVLTSLCRRIDVVLTSRDPAKFDASADGEVADNESKLVMGVTVADPDYLMTVPMPAKGTVTFGDLCGADVSMSTAATIPTNVLATDFFTQVNAMRTAKPAKK